MTRRSGCAICEHSNLRFKQQCTRAFCESELRQIEEFGKWITEMVMS